jgi:hypothetical protein
MIKKLTILFVLTCQLSISQNVNIKWIDLKSEKTTFYPFGGNNTTNLFSFYDNDSNLIIRELDDDLKFIKNTTISPKLSKKTYKYLEPLFLKNNILHFYQDVQNKQDKQYLYTNSSDYKLTFEKDIKIIDEEERINKTKHFGKIVTSPDSSKILICHKIENKETERYDVSFKVYDNKFENIIREGVFEIPFNGQKYSTTDYIIDNKGGIYIAISAFKIFKINIDNSYKEINFKKPTLINPRFNLFINKKNELIISGLASESNSGLSQYISNNLFINVIDCETLVEKKSYVKKIKELYPEKLSVKTNDYMQYDFHKIIEKEDNTYSLLFDQSRRIVMSNSIYYDKSVYNSSMHSTELIDRGDFAVINLNTNFDVEKTVKISNYFSKYVSLYKENKIYVIYTDLIKNLNLNENEKDRVTKFTSPKNIGFYLSTIDEKGNIKTEILNSEFLPDIQYCKEINNKILLLNYNKIGLLKITK